MGDPRSSRRWRNYIKWFLSIHGDMCGLCGKPGSTSVDHIIPISKGGPMWDSANHQPAHVRCQVMQGARLGGLAIQAKKRAEKAQQEWSRKWY